jgi:glutaredoxin
MVRVIGQLGCANCQISKMTLEKKGVDFNYEIFDDLSEEEQIKLENLATSKGMMKMPLILKDNELVTIEEL